MPRHVYGRARGAALDGAQEPQAPQEDFSETHIKTRRAVQGDGEVIYGADIERTRMVTGEDSPGMVTESHSGVAQAACGCLIEGAAKPRFHRDGTMVCQNHYYFCGICGLELLPPNLVLVDKRVYCKGCGERVIDEVLATENCHPGTFDKALIAHLSVQKGALRRERWKRSWDRLLGRTSLTRRV
jgi:DNA-directed RNA polymerase subunit RPC12/RpoP